MGQSELKALLAKKITKGINDNYIYNPSMNE